AAFLSSLYLMTSSTTTIIRLSGPRLAFRFGLAPRRELALLNEERAAWQRFPSRVAAISQP
ncbi:MAG TPA: hypothetical protein VK457_01195, partial [Chloroflexota bacterium]|nr:hypothetical protein [Chloroflexota bacterium]